MTLVRPLSSVAAPVDDQVALELEDLSAELAGFGFPRGLVLTLGIWRAGGAVSPLRGRGLRGEGEERRGLGARLEKRRAQQAVHGRHTVGREGGRGPSVVGGVACQFPQTPGEVHGRGLHGGHPHHPLKGTGVLGQQPQLLWA